MNLKSNLTLIEQREQEKNSVKCYYTLSEVDIKKLREDWDKPGKFLIYEPIPVYIPLKADNEFKE